MVTFRARRISEEIAVKKNVFGKGYHRTAIICVRLSNLYKHTVHALQEHIYYCCSSYMACHSNFIPPKGILGSTHISHDSSASVPWES